MPKFEIESFWDITWGCSEKEYNVLSGLDGSSWPKILENKSVLGRGCVKLWRLFPRKWPRKPNPICKFFNEHKKSENQQRKSWNIIETNWTLIQSKFDSFLQTEIILFRSFSILVAPVAQEQKCISVKKSKITWINVQTVSRTFWQADCHHMFLKEFEH